METSRAERRGRIKQVWNDTFKRFNTYRLSQREKWIMIGNLSAPHLSKYQMNKLTENK